MTTNKVFVPIVKANFNILMNSLRNLEDLNSDLCVEVTIEENFVRIVIRSKSDPSCSYFLRILAVWDACFAMNEISRAQELVDLLINLNRYYRVRKATLGKLVER